MVKETAERKFVTITEATRIIEESDSKEEAMAKLHNLPKRNNGRSERPSGYISLREAEKKYGIHHATLSRWIKKGLIPKVNRTKNWVFIPESIIAELAKKYKEDPGRGKRTAYN